MVEEVGSLFHFPTTRVGTSQYEFTITRRSSYYGNKDILDEKALKLIYNPDEKNNIGYVCNLYSTELLPTSSSSWIGIKINDVEVPGYHINISLITLLHKIQIEQHNDYDTEKDEYIDNELEVYSYNLPCALRIMFKKLGAETITYILHTDVDAKIYFGMLFQTERYVLKTNSIDVQEFRDETVKFHGHPALVSEYNQRPILKFTNWFSENNQVFIEPIFPSPKIHDNSIEINGIVNYDSLFGIIVKTVSPKEIHSIKVVDIAHDSVILFELQNPTAKKSNLFMNESNALYMGIIFNFPTKYQYTEPTFIDICTKYTELHRDTSVGKETNSSYKIIIESDKMYDDNDIILFQFNQFMYKDTGISFAI